MVTVSFYEKPGCVNNTKQKELLAQSGHKVISYDLLKTEWDASTLRKYFANLSVPDWFNYSAPAIKEGWIKPHRLNEHEAINLMLKEPVLIRRPLMLVNDEYRVGFDIEAVKDWIGLEIKPAINMEHEDMEACVQMG